MKRFLLAVIVIMLMIALLIGCRDNRDFTERYTIEAGRAAFAQYEDYAMPKMAQSLITPDDTNISRPYESVGIMVVYIISEEVDDDLNPIYLYGLADFEGNMVVECIYDSITKSGNFFMGTKEHQVIDEDDTSYDLFYLDNFLFNTPNSIETFEAIGEEYFALYTYESSEVFNREGKAMFGVSRQMTEKHRYSICDEFIFVQEPDSATYFIWEIVEDKINLVKSYISTGNSYYVVSYMGAGNFLVVNTTVTNSTSYDYSNVINDQTYYYKQNAIELSRNKTEKIVALEIPIMGVFNKYSPTIAYVDRLDINLNQGYSAVLTHLLNSDKQRIGQNYYVMNSNYINTIKMPDGLSPFVFTYKNDMGFVGNALDNYAAGLFYLNGELAWSRQDAAFYAHSFNDSKYVLAKSIGNELKYGLLNMLGEIIIDFEYEYLATFTEGYSVALAEGAYYRISDEGIILEEISDIKNDTTQLTFNTYIFEQNNKIGIKNYAGDTLIDALYDSIYFRGYLEGKLYIIFNLGDTTIAYSLA